MIIYIALPVVQFLYIVMYYLMLYFTKQFIAKFSSILPSCYKQEIKKLISLKS